jgi:pyochelin synthetase
MNHLQVLDEVAARGLRLTVSGADLRLQGPQQRMDPELVGRIRAVKAELVRHLSADLAPAEPAPAGFPLTLLQRAFLIGRGNSVEIGNVASHIYHEIDGCWDIPRLELALRTVVTRHGALRTRFTADGRQVEEPAAVVRIGLLDLRGEPEAGQRETLAARREQRSHRILPSDRAGLLAVDVTLLSQDRMRLHVGHDGLVMDGISMFLFFEQWWRAYADDGEPAAGEPASEVSFADYVASLEAMRTKPPMQRSREYWLRRIPDLPPHPELPLRASPSAMTRPRFAQYSARLDPSSWRTLKTRAAGAGLTPTVVLLAAYAETLARWGAGDRFTLATTVANRPPIHPRIADAIGNFSETLLIEIGIDRHQTFRQRAQALQARLRRDLDHRHFSGIEVLREIARGDSSADARMPFTFNSAIGYLRSGVDGSALERFGPEVYTSSQTPQVWLNAFAFEQHDGVVVQVDAVAGLFPDQLIGDMVSGYSRLLKSLCGEAAWSAIRFSLLPASQRARRAAEAFTRWAVRTPDAPAVLSSGRSVSYGELFRRAAHAAAWLRARHVRRDELVGLVMHRGPEYVVGILATLMAGAAYLPVDATWPAERIRYVLRDGQVRWVLSNAGWPAGASDPGTLAIDVASPLPPVLAGDGEPDEPGAGPDDLAYVLYTSGTTGEPKGVMISHRSVANVVADCNMRFAVGPADRFIAVSSFTFDLSVYDVFGALSAGAALVLPDADRAADPLHWLELCRRFGVSVWNSVPAIAALMQEQAGPGGDPRLAALRLVMLSGDRIPPELPAALRQVKDDVTLISLGGPTETTIWNISHPIDAADDAGRIPYGRPNANNRAYILDADGEDTPDWVTGEICAAGTGLARGYWGDQERTARRFWYDERRGERLYRTGDLGRYLPDGNIDIIGRSDFQIKINGYRIEPGEVETRLVAIPAVKQAAVVRQAAARGDRLVAHLAAAGRDRPGDEDIRRALREHLPDYMTPVAISWHDGLPLTPNGKVDRAALTGLPAGRAGRADGNRTTEVMGLEQKVCALWASVLGLPAASIARDQDFYDLGGESMAAARILAGVRKQFGVGITLDRLHDVRTVQAMAAYVAAGAGGTR